MGEKTEKATPKKLRDAMKKGQVAKSQDFPAAFTFMASILITMGMIDWLYGLLGGFTVTAFETVNHDQLENIISSFYKEALVTIFTAVIPIMGLTAMVGIIANFLATGPVFAPEVFKFDIKKFNPVDNLKAKFKMKTLVELVKQILKISIAAFIIWTVVNKSIPVLTTAVKLPLIDSLMIFYYFLKEVVIKVGLFFIVVAVADLVYQKHNFAKEMMMEKFEVKQEYKNTEGDPQIKGKRKEIAREIAYSDGPAGGVKKANAVVTNPTHIAIAIAYDREEDVAPYIVTMGQDFLAERIVELADEYEVPVMRNIKLARRLWEFGEIYEYVPEDSYEALAEVLRWVESLKDTENEHLVDLEK